VLRLAVGVEGVDLSQLSVAKPVAQMIEVTPASARSRDRMGHALRIGEGHPRFRLFRQVQAVALDVGVGGVEQRQIVLIAAGEVLGQVRLESRHRVERLVRPTRVMPRWASPKSTVRPPWAPLTAMVTCSRPGFIAA
jgi:hypothetical protein